MSDAQLNYFKVWLPKQCADATSDLEKEWTALAAAGKYNGGNRIQRCIAALASASRNLVAKSVAELKTHDAPSNCIDFVHTVLASWQEKWFERMPALMASAGLVSDGMAAAVLNLIDPIKRNLSDSIAIARSERKMRAKKESTPRLAPRKPSRTVKTARGAGERNTAKPPKRGASLQAALDAINAIWNGPPSNVSVNEIVRQVIEWCKKERIAIPGKRTVETALEILRE